MGNVFEDKLAAIEQLISEGLTAARVTEVLAIIEAPPISGEVLEHMKLYSETLPKGREVPFSPQQRYLHFLWDVFDKLPLSLVVPFSIPFRRLLAGHLFKRCGAALIAEENVRFKFGQLLEVGDNAFFNRGVFLDTKEVSSWETRGPGRGRAGLYPQPLRVIHLERTYARVVIEDYAKVYAGATILPGVRVGAESIVASGSLVTRDVPPNRVVAGSRPP